MTDLYHVTQRQSVDSIIRDGLSPTAALRAVQAADLPNDPAERDPMIESLPEERADREMEMIIKDARREADVPSEWPSHEDGVFFWSSRATAERTADDGYGSSPIVAVDSTLLPDDAILLSAPTGPLDALFSTFYYVYTDRASYPPEEEERMYQEVVEWWGSVEVYDGTARYKHEVWTDVRIPPTAITWIHDPGEDRRIYTGTPDPDQLRFVDMFGGDTE